MYILYSVQKIRLKREVIYCYRDVMIAFVCTPGGVSISGVCRNVNKKRMMENKFPF